MKITHTNTQKLNQEGKRGRRNREIGENQENLKAKINEGKTPSPRNGAGTREGRLADTGATDTVSHDHRPVSTSI